MNFFNKIGNKIKLVLFNPDIPSSFSPKEKAKEQIAHKETERRRQILEEQIREKAIKGLEENIAKELTPEEQEEAYRKARENRENQ
jgi:hypothetical protein